MSSLGFNYMAPRPKSDRTPTATPYPHAALPRLIREAVECACVRHQLSPAIYSTVALAAADLATNGLAILEMPDGTMMNLSLFFIILAESGTGKSRGFSTFFKPFRDHDNMDEDIHAKAWVDFPDLRKCWRKQVNDVVSLITKQRKKGEPYGHLEAELKDLLTKKPAEPRRQNYMLSDTTGPAFIKRIAGNGQTIGLACGEAAVLFKHLHQYFGDMCLTWDGEPIFNTRKSDGTIAAHNARVMTLVPAQHAVFNEFCAKHGDIALGMGAWARFLFCCPPRQTIDIHSDLGLADTTAPLDAFLARLTVLISERNRRTAIGGTEPDVIKLHADASDCLSNFSLEMKERTRTGGDLCDVSEFAAKATIHAARLASVFTYIGGELTVTLDSMERAITIIRYHLLEYINRFSIAETVPDVVHHAKDMETHLHRRYWSKGWRRVALSRLERHGPTQELRKLEVLMPALQLLRSQGKVALSDHGRTTFVEYRPSIANDE